MVKKVTLFFSSLLPFLLHAQCNVQDSVTYNFTSSTISVRNFPGASFLPRTNAASTSTIMYSEGRSSNRTFAASSSTVYAAAPAKSNIFFGGDDVTNGHANTQVICKKTYNLFSGPIKIRGTFFNRSSDPNYNESYIGIVPANYNYYAPLDADPGMSGSGLPVREGLIIGAVNGSGNAFLMDHKSSSQASGFVNGPVGSGINFSRWYTMEAVFEVVNNNLYLKSATYNDGTVRKPLGSNVLIGNVSNYNWLDSIQLIAGVDDMLADVTIVKFGCDGCVTQDSVVFDMVSKFVTQTPYSGISTQASTDFSKIKTPFALEAITSNDSFFLNSKNCNSAASYRRTIYFGGDQPSPEGFSASSIVTKMTYNLFEGPLTLTAAFNNRSNTPEYNESWFSILPHDYKFFLSPVMTPSVNREGVRVGAWPTQSLVVDSRNISADDRIVEPFKIHNYAGWGQWYEARVVWDTANGQFRCAEFSINNGTGWRKVWNNPINIGPVSSYPWLNNVRLSILADDMIDSIGIRKVICTKVVKKTCQVVKKDSSFCRNNLALNLDSFFIVNGSAPKNHSYSIVAFNGSRNHSYLNTYSLNQNKFISRSWPGGSWRIRIITECGVIDSITLTLKNEPILGIFPKKDTTICSDANLSPEFYFIDSTTVSNGTWKWTGDNINLNNFNINRNALTVFSVGYSVKGIFTTLAGCKDSLLIQYRIRNKDEISLNVNDDKICTGEEFKITATCNPRNSILWTQDSRNDGIVSTSSPLEITYKHGSNDERLGLVKIKAQTTAMPDDVCATDLDSVDVAIIKYPVPAISDSIRLCAPSFGTIRGLEISGKNPADLVYRWQTPAGTRQSGNDLLFDFPLQGKADAYFTVTDTNGPCSATLQKPGWIQVYPAPDALFQPDPTDYSMIPGAVFKFRNLSTLNQSLFPGSIVSWQWNLTGIRHQDYSTLKEPVFTVPDDTARYLVSLIAVSDKGCRDTALKPVFAVSKFEVYMPTSFSPDGEGNAANNTYMIAAFNYRSLKLKIYSRWGEKLFETTSVKNGWNGMYMGAECQEGVYVAIAEVKDMEGYTHVYKRTFHLMR